MPDREWIEWDTGGLRGKPVLSPQGRAILGAVTGQMLRCDGCLPGIQANRGTCEAAHCEFAAIRRAYLGDGESEAKPIAIEGKDK